MEGSTLVIMGRNGEILQTDASFSTLFGFTLDEVVGKTLQDVVMTQPYLLFLLEFLDATSNSRLGLHFLAECKHKNGIVFSVNVSSPSLYPQPELSGTFALQISRAQNALSTITFNEDGSITSSSNASIFEYSLSDLKRLTLDSILPCLPPQQLKGENRPSYKYLNGNVSYDRPKFVQCLTKSGLTRTLLMEIVKIRDSSTLLAKFEHQDFENMEAIFVVDSEGIILDTNQYTTILFGFQKNDLLNSKLAELAPDISTFRETSSFKRQKTSLSQWNPSASFHSSQIRTKYGEMVPIIWKTVEMGSSDRFVIRMRRSFHVNLQQQPEHQQSNFVNKLCKMKQVGSYLIENTIGMGAFGKVKKGTHLFTGREVAIKILNKGLLDANDLERSKREGTILQSLNHPNIVKFYGSEETDKHLFFFLELVEGTDLKTHLIQNEPCLKERKDMFKQIASAICFCHRVNVMHRDLKPCNILVDDQKQIKLIDFGLSNFSNEGTLRSTFCGSPAYAAPEMLLGQTYIGPEVDIWSLGVILYGMVIGKLPFENVGQLLKGKYEIPVNMDQDLMNLITIMLESDNTKRATIKDVCEHKWIMKHTQEEE